MTFPAAQPVISGKPYPVRRVRDRQPERLDDFTAGTYFVIDLDGQEYSVWGPGVQHEGHVRVHEKSDQGAGKDIRVWLVHPNPDGPSFTATHVGSDTPTAVMGAATTQT